MKKFKDIFRLTKESLIAPMKGIEKIVKVDGMSELVTTDIFYKNGLIAKRNIQYIRTNDEINFKYDSNNRLVEIFQDRMNYKITRYDENNNIKEIELCISGFKSIYDYEYMPNSEFVYDDEFRTTRINQKHGCMLVKETCTSGDDVFDTYYTVDASGSVIKEFTFHPENTLYEYIENNVETVYLWGEYSSFKAHNKPNIIKCYNNNNGDKIKEVASDGTTYITDYSYNTNGKIASKYTKRIDSNGNISLHDSLINTYDNNGLIVSKKEAYRDSKVFEDTYEYTFYK